MSYIVKNLKSLVFLVLIGCASSPEDNDPYKDFNRGAFEFNRAVDKNVLKPVAITYKDVTHDGLRESISNFLFNIKEPFNFVNYVLCFDPENAITSLCRFCINSTVGAFGLFDISSELGVPKYATSHKETLKKWGVQNGNYIMLPLLGPSSTRDTIAEPVSWFMDPVGYFIGTPWMIAKAVLGAVSDRAEHGETIDAGLKDGSDPYSTVKSLYFQQYGVKSEEEKKKEKDEEMAALLDED